MHTLDTSLQLHTQVSKHFFLCMPAVFQEPFTVDVTPHLISENPKLKQGRLSKMPDTLPTQGYPAGEEQPGLSEWDSESRCPESHRSFFPTQNCAFSRLPGSAWTASWCPLGYFGSCSLPLPHIPGHPGKQPLPERVGVWSSQDSATWLRAALMKDKCGYFYGLLRMLAG